MAERVGRSIRAVIPPVAQAFLEERRWLVAGALDDDERPWASVLAGPRGFIRAVDDRSVRIAAQPASGDPLERAFATGARAGFIAIDLETRRRLRLNGQVRSHDAAGILVDADAVYSNCPQYIQRRSEDGSVDRPPESTPRRSAQLTDRQRDWLRAADTFFIVTAAPGEGVDASHRGGMPGFVRVEGQRIVWPDYAGNAMFNTLGNIDAWPRAGLLVPDFDTGGTLHVTGRAAIDWDESHAAAVDGAERLVTLDVESVVELAATLPVRLRLREYSPANPRSL
jgi:predicted pyridoxine 5'-phosphate oxidase superfamily flavin-nucleotide-binding protein